MFDDFLFESKDFLASKAKKKKNYDIKKTCLDELPPHLIYMFER